MSYYVALGCGERHFGGRLSVASGQDLDLTSNSFWTASAPAFCRFGVFWAFWSKKIQTSDSFNLNPTSWQTNLDSSATDSKPVRRQVSLHWPLEQQLIVLGPEHPPHPKAIKCKSASGSNNWSSGLGKVGHIFDRLICNASLIYSTFMYTCTSNIYWGFMATCAQCN